MLDDDSMPDSARDTTFGRMPDGRDVRLLTIGEEPGPVVEVLTLGATVHRLVVTCGDGERRNVVLGHPDVEERLASGDYIGGTIGRYANRIAGGRFALDGTTFQLPTNDGRNSLHGGGRGFDKVAWRVVSVDSGPQARVVLAHRSAAGESGYPGALDVTVTYALDGQGSLAITFDATTDRATIVNLTNHAIFNLAGEGAPGGALDQLLTIPARAFTPVSADLIPTGELRPVAGTPFDFRAPRRLAQDIRNGRDEQLRFGRGYDHNFALDKGVTAAPELAARLEDPISGRVLDVLTTEPGVQVYAGNFLDGTYAGKGGHLYRMGDGIALEPQKFPDAPNHPTFASARIDPDRPYRHAMVYRLSCRNPR
jgi:aldose 1-epimerase